MAYDIQIDPREVNIPASVLNGYIDYFLPVHNEFINRTLQFYLKSIYESYWERSHLDQPPNMTPDPGWKPHRGRDDEHGDNWIQLRPSTYEIKARIDPDEQRTYLRERTSQAAVQTLRRLNTINFQDKNGDGINIRSGRLLASFYPGNIDGNGNYLARADQKVTKKRGMIGFETNVKEHYETVQQSRRKILTPEKGVRWMNDAVRSALPFAEKVFIDLRNRPDNPFNKRKR